MPTADTSWLLRLLNADDPRHPEAQKQARGLTNILLPGLVLAETLQVVEFETRARSGSKAGREAAREVFHALLENPVFALVTDYDATLSHQLYSEHGALSYVDAAAASVAHLHDGDLLSFDGAQVKALRGLKA